jgi:hypothetical protein
MRGDEFPKSLLVSRSRAVEGGSIHRHILPCRLVHTRASRITPASTVPFVGPGVSQQPSPTVARGTAMTETNSTALQTALAYHRAWTSHNIEQAMTYISEDIVCRAPAGRLDGAEAFRAFMGPFVQIVTSSKLVAAFGDETTAVLMYDTDTVPVKDAPGAECLTVEGGKITRMRIIFDRVPFDAARRATAGDRVQE